MKGINKLPKYKLWAAELEFRDSKGKIHEAWHSFHAYGIGLGMRVFIKIDSQWYELNEEEKNEGILW